MVQGKIDRGRHTDHPAMGATPSGLTSAHLHHPPHILQAGCSSCRLNNSVKALKATSIEGVVKQVLIAYFIGNISAKSFKIRSRVSKL